MPSPMLLSLHNTTSFLSLSNKSWQPFFFQLDYYSNPLYKSLRPENLETTYGRVFYVDPFFILMISPSILWGVKLTRPPPCLKIFNNLLLFTKEYLNSRPFASPTRQPQAWGSPGSLEGYTPCHYLVSPFPPRTSGLSCRAHLRTHLSDKAFPGTVEEPPQSQPHFLLLRSQQQKGMHYSVYNVTQYLYCF